MEPNRRSPGRVCSCECVLLHFLIRSEMPDVTLACTEPGAKYECNYYNNIKDKAQANRRRVVEPHPVPQCVDFIYPRKVIMRKGSFTSGVDFLKWALCGANRVCHSRFSTKSRRFARLLRNTRMMMMHRQKQLQHRAATAAAW